MRFPTRGKARKDMNYISHFQHFTSFIDSTLYLYNIMGLVRNSGLAFALKTENLQKVENFCKKIWKFKNSSYLCNPKTKRWW